jgi:hypothetical protein
MLAIFSSLDNFLTGHTVMLSCWNKQPTWVVMLRFCGRIRSNEFESDLKLKTISNVEMAIMWVYMNSKPCLALNGIMCYDCAQIKGRVWFFFFRIFINQMQGLVISEEWNLPRSTPAILGEQSMYRLRGQTFWSDEVWLVLLGFKGEVLASCSTS